MKRTTRGNNNTGTTRGHISARTTRGHISAIDFNSFSSGTRGHICPNAGDSAYNYLKDCIEIFEEYGWYWSYHAFREWNGWSVEHGPDKNDNNPAKEPTSRMKLLKEWFAKNKKPEQMGK